MTDTLEKIYEETVDELDFDPESVDRPKWSVEEAKKRLAAKSKNKRG